MQVDGEEIGVKGKHIMVNSVRVDNKVVVVTGKWIKTASIRDEWDQDIEDPASLIAELRNSGVKADIFTFWQRLPETKPKYNYYMEWESIAAIPIKSFNHWWGKLPEETRRNIKKAVKRGVIVKVVDFDDELVRGIMNIYNEIPIRQGKPFWHYGKKFDVVKRENSTFLDKSDFIGAYYNEELVGFLKLVNVGEYAFPMQILSMVKHRDKAPTNALIAKAIEICDQKRIPYLVYGTWSSGGLSEFKRRNGFEKFLLPRYYIPLNIKGTIALKLHLHHGIVGMLPEKLILYLIDLRTKWYSRKYKDAKISE